MKRRCYYGDPERYTAWGRWLWYSLVRDEICPACDSDPPYLCACMPFKGPRWTQQCLYVFHRGKKYRKVFVAHITVLFKLIIYNHIIYSHYTPFPMYRVGLRTPRALMLHLFQGPPQNYATFSGHLGNLPIYNQDEMLHPNHPSLKKSVYGWLISKLFCLNNYF